MDYSEQLFDEYRFSSLVRRRCADHEDSGQEQEETLSSEEIPPPPSGSDQVKNVGTSLKALSIFSAEQEDSVTVRHDRPRHKHAVSKRAPLLRNRRSRRGCHNEKDDYGQPRRRSCSFSPTVLDVIYESAESPCLHISRSAPEQFLTAALLRSASTSSGRRDHNKQENTSNASFSLYESLCLTTHQRCLDPSSIRAAGQVAMPRAAMLPRQGQSLTNSSQQQHHSSLPPNYGSFSLRNSYFTTTDAAASSSARPSSLCPPETSSFLQQILHIHGRPNTTRHHHAPPDEDVQEPWHSSATTMVPIPPPPLASSEYRWLPEIVAVATAPTMSHQSSSSISSTSTTTSKNASNTTPLKRPERKLSGDEAEWFSEDDHDLLKKPPSSSFDSSSSTKKIPPKVTTKAGAITEYNHKIAMTNSHQSGEALPPECGGAVGSCGECTTKASPPNDN